MDGQVNKLMDGWMIISIGSVKNWGSTILGGHGVSIQRLGEHNRVILDVLDVHESFVSSKFSFSYQFFIIELHEDFLLMYKKFQKITLFVTYSPFVDWFAVKFNLSVYALDIPIG